MNILFIHNNNLPLPLRKMIYENVAEQYYIKTLLISQDATDEDDYDLFLDKTLLVSNLEEFDLIIIPLSLSAINPLEYTGIRCAAHIRLDKRFHNIYTPILFIGPDRLEEILKVSELGSFLLTPHVYLSTVNTPEKFYAWIGQHNESFSKMSESEYERFMSRFEVVPPTNYDDHHSLANIWGATVLTNRVTTEEIPSEIIDRSILNSLYFKYIRTKYRLSNNSSTTVIEMKAQGKRFLLIDDEAEKGWEFALKHYLRASSKFETIAQKVQSYDDFEDSYKNLIENGDFDIIFLDLRLNGLDEENNQNPSSFSGMSVLKKIKDINKGTQVIMFTASNKSWNLKALLDEGADGYYVKPSPEYYTDAFVDNNFVSLKEAIIHCLERTYLRPLYKKLKELMICCDNSIINQDNIDEIKNHLITSYDLLSSSNNTTQYSYAFLSLFGVVEDFVNYFIGSEGNGTALFYYDDIETSVEKVGNWTIRNDKLEKVDGEAKQGSFSIANKVFAIYKDCLHKDLDIQKAKLLCNFKDRRNTFIHKEERELSFRTPTPEIGEKRAYTELFDIVFKLLSDCKKP